jgi:MoaA/NifB/PqqE/SkfB family radical SAM enzyme
MCPLPARPEARAGLFLAPALYARLMAEAKEMALPALTLGLGSEPLLSENPAQKIALAVKAGVMDVRLGTNGLLLAEPIIDGLIDSGLTRLEISVDAVEPKAYQAIRGGSLKALEKRIHLFLNKRAKRGVALPLLRVSFLTLPQNKGQLPSFLKRWRGVADLVSTQKPIWFPGSKLAPPPTKAAKAVPCGQPWQRLGVTHDGRLWPCCSWYGEKILAQNVKFRSVGQIWLSPELLALRQSLLLNRPSKACLACAKAGAF